MFATIAMALALQASAEKGTETPETKEPAEVMAGGLLFDGAATETEASVEVPTAPDLLVPRDTPVHLMVVNEVSTKDHGAGHKFSLRVDQPVVVDGQEIIPVGTTAWGVLDEAEKSGNVGKRGKLSATLSHIDFRGTTIPIEGGTEADGKSGKGEAILGVLAMGPLGLFAKGNNAKIKAGEKMTAFVSEDVMIGNDE